MTLLTIDIRPATVEDGDAIAAVHAAAWRHAYAGILPHTSLLAMINRRDAHWWGRAVKRGTCIMVVEMAGLIVGYITYGLNRARSLPQDGEIYEIYLLPEYQGIGLGKRMFDTARRELHRHGCQGLVIWTLEENNNANEFYANLGGEDVAEGHEIFAGKSIKKIAYVWR
ncbi:MAG: GNAT family N-acetyltransferase [Pseudomonadota bacterium]